MQDGNQKHMVVSERAVSAEGGYQETNIALHTLYLRHTHTHTHTHIGLSEHIPKQGDVGHAFSPPPPPPPPPPSEMMKHADMFL